MSLETPPFFWSDSHTIAARMKSSEFSHVPALLQTVVSLVSKSTGRFPRENARIAFSRVTCVPGSSGVIVPAVIPPYLKTTHAPSSRQLRRNTPATYLFAVEYTDNRQFPQSGSCGREH